MWKTVSDNIPSTGNFIRHVKTNHQPFYEKLLLEKNESKSLPEDTNSLIPKCDLNEFITKQLIVGCGLPFR